MTLAQFILTWLAVSVPIALLIGRAAALGAECEG